MAYQQKSMGPVPMAWGLGILLGFHLALCATPLLAQVGVPLPPKPPQLPVEPPPAQPPALEVPPPAPPVPGEPITGAKIFVKEVRLIGNTTFTSQQLTEVTGPYTNRDVTAEELEALRLALTYYYVNHGYVTSGALIPEQTVTDGILTVQVVEGRLAEIKVEDTRWFKSERSFQRGH
ncbi:MAG TPA: POTRA domain-containing protein [Nitrospira sp.]|nr:POTRA domain-containing protein [Nitrospira sp.]